MNRLSSFIRRVGGFYISVQVLLATHLIAFLLGMAVMYGTAVAVVERML